jgi:hypothetical protein
MQVFVTLPFGDVLTVDVPEGGTVALLVDHVLSECGMVRTQHTRQKLRLVNSDTGEILSDDSALVASLGESCLLRHRSDQLRDSERRPRPHGTRASSSEPHGCVSGPV